MNNEFYKIDMDERVDEAENLIPQARSTTRSSGLRGLVSSVRALYSTRPSNTVSSSRLLETIKEEEEEFEDIDLTQDRPKSRLGTSDWRRFIPSVRNFTLGLVCFAVSLGVGCGLGLGLRYHDSFGHLFNPEEPLFNRYGIPNDLRVVPTTQLINSTQLNLQTAFPISRVPRTREYEFNISHALAAPDGFYKPMILANDQSPGPLIEANTGDTVRVRVNNLMPNTTTSIHFHGINQYNSTWNDGVAGVSQCGIPPAGGSWTYEFVVGGQRGTFWWHAHTGVQYTDGLFGPIVIHDADEMVPETDDDKILFLGENYHAFAAELAESYLSPSSYWDPNEPGVEPLSDNLLLNGQNTYNCSIKSTTFSSPLDKQQDTPGCTGGQTHTTSIKPGSTLRLRLINHSAYLSYWFSIDNHPLTIVEIDGVEIEPLASAGVHVNIGQRYSVLITADQTPETYTMRSALEQDCFLPFSTYTSSGLEGAGYSAVGALQYEGTPSNHHHHKAPAAAAAAAAAANPYGCHDLPFDAPVPRRPEAAYALAGAPADPRYAIDFQFRQAGAVNRIFVNRTSWAPYVGDATLWQALGQDFSSLSGGSGDGGGYNNWGFRLDQQVLLVPQGSGAVQVAVNSLDVMEHPFHMHGHTVQIVGWGSGRYAGPNSSSTTWNLDNPMRRDTFTVPEQSHVVIRFRADNPGMWILHCHVAWHLEAGMAVSFLERPDDLKALIADMHPDAKTLAKSFCSARDG